MIVDIETPSGKRYCRWELNDLPSETTMREILEDLDEAPEGSRAIADIAGLRWDLTAELRKLGAQ